MARKTKKTTEEGQEGNQPNISIDQSNEQLANSTATEEETSLSDSISSNDDSGTDYEELKKKLLAEYESQKNIPEENLEDSEELKQIEINQEPEENNEEIEWSQEEDSQETTESLESLETQEEQIQPNSNNDDVLIENVSQINSRTDEQNLLTDEQKNITPDIDQGISKVALSKESSIAIMIGAGLVILYIIYKIITPSSEEIAARPKKEVNNNLPITRPVQDVGQTIVVPDVPKLPEVPQLTTPVTPPAPTPPPPPVLDLALPTPPQIPAVVQPPKINANTNHFTLQNFSNPLGSVLKENPAEAQRKQAKLKAGIMFMTGGSSPSANKNKDAKGNSLSSLSKSPSPIAATYIPELNRVIGQGKMISATLETAINTDLPGMVRGLVSRDVYSEAGKNILIPRGSRLIGSYSSNITYGQGRVQINWARVITPDGIDVAISSPSTDNLGRTGVGGDVDNHISKNLSTMLMMSVINVALGKYADKTAGNNSGQSTTVVLPSTNTTGTTSTTDTTSTTTNAPVGTTVTTGPASTNTQAAYQSSIDQFTTYGKQMVENQLNIPPTITIDQGTAVKIYVMQDIFFPGRSANLTRVIE